MRLTAPDPTWVTSFAEQRDQLAVLLPTASIEHIGSTSIPGIAAKPVVDILIGVQDATDWVKARDALAADGWTLEGQRGPDHERGPHAWLCLPSPADRQFIAHVVVADGPIWGRRIAFRDYLRAHLDAAHEYEALKQDLAVEHNGDIGAYTKAKAAFVADILNCGTHRRRRATCGTSTR